MPSPKGTRRKAADVPDPFVEDRQPELTPAADAVPPDAARSAIATINTQLSEFDKVQAGLADLEKRHKDVVYPVDTPKGMEDAKAARKEVKDIRVKVEHARKAAKAPVLNLGRDIDARAGAITTRLQALENPIDKQIVDQETKEADRKRDLEARVREIQDTPATCIGKTAAQLQEVLDGINGLPLETFAEYRPQAAAAQERARQLVTSMHAQAVQAELAQELERQRKAEENRRAALQLRVTSIREALALPYRNAARVQQAIDQLEAMVIGEDFEEFGPAAREAKAETLAKLRELHAAKVAAETPAPTPAPAPTMESMAREARLEQDPELRDERTPGQQQHGTVDGLSQGAPRVYADEAPPRIVPMETASAVNAAFNRLESDHDRVNDERGAELVRTFGPGGPGALADDIERTLERDLVDAPLGSPGPREHYDDKTGAGGNHEAQRAGYEFVTGRPVHVVAGPVVMGARLREQLQARPDPFTAPDPDAIVDAEVRQRPTDAEILGVVASHYDVTWGMAASWLRTMDVRAALAQLSFEGVPRVR